MIFTGKLAEKQAEVNARQGLRTRVLGKLYSAWFNPAEVGIKFEVRDEIDFESKCAYEYLQDKGYIKPGVVSVRGVSDHAYRLVITAEGIDFYENGLEVFK